MASKSKSEIIRACYGAFIAKDRQLVEDAFNDDFISPALTTCDRHSRIFRALRAQ